MAGQGVGRREILRIMGTAAAAAHFPGFSKWTFACGHIGNAALQVKPAAYAPQFFTPGEYAMVERLTEIIIPSDTTPGAKEAGVAEFIDFMVASDSAEVQYPFRMGLGWLNAQSERSLGKKFMELTQGEQTSLLEPLGFKDKARPGEEDGRKFFALMREYTVTGFYTTQIGYKELDNPSLRFYSESPECPHKDDPEHQHLTQPSS
jgi:gluconate 2-dehydrogenase gamma chain